MEKVKIYYDNRQKKVKIPKGLKLLLRRVCQATLSEEKFEGNAEVSLSFVDNEQIRELNSLYRNKDTATDVLSFPLSDDGVNFDIDEETGRKQLGDIVISLERAQAQAEAYNHTFTREVCFLTVHSVLHLLGYDHEENANVPAEKSGGIMFFKQEQILEALGVTREMTL